MASTNQVQEAGPAGHTKAALVVTDRDIIFNCPACKGELVVDRDGAGMEVPCSHCGQSLTVPTYQTRAIPPPVVELPATAAAPLPAVAAPSVPPRVVATPVPPATPATPVEQPAQPPVQRTFNHDTLSPEQLTRRLDELKHQLKENRSQDTEMRGHVNRATIELHRLQLRLKTLQERHADIQAELVAIQSRTGENTG